MARRSVFADDPDLDGGERIPFKAFLTGPDGVKVSRKSYVRHRRAGIAPAGLVGASCRRTFSQQEYAEYHTRLALRAESRNRAAQGRRDEYRQRAITHQAEAGALYRALQRVPQGHLAAVRQVLRIELAARGVPLTEDTHG